MRRLSVMLLALAGAPLVTGQDPFPIGVIPGALRYDVSRFDVHVGDRVTIRFQNNGLMPHNLLVTRPGKVDAVMLAAMALGGDGPARDYKPQTDDLLAATPILQPGDAHLLSFTAPGTAGILGYLCTFPGHGTIMRGEIRVLPGGTELGAPLRFGGERAPTPDEDRLARSGASAFPLGTEDEPLVMRTFLPDPGLSDEVLAHHRQGLDAKPYDVNSGLDRPGVVKAIPGLPAAIAVNFGGRLSYAWDTVECRLLYAWVGGFLDMTDYWGAGAGGGRKSFDYVPALQGSLVYLATGPHPMGAEIEPRYLGYLMEGGTPVFRFKVGPFEIRERIAPGDGPFEIACDFEVISEADFKGGGVDVVFQLDYSESLRGRIASEHLLPDTTTVQRDCDSTRFSLRVVLTGEERLPPPQPFADLPRAGLVATARRVVTGDPVVPALGIQAFAPGRTIFSDREYTFDEVPEALLGADHVPTRNDDKLDGRDVSWQIEVSGPATVWVLLDSRVEAPAWLTDADAPFTRTDLVVTTSGNWRYQAWRRDVAGSSTTELGPQSGGSFYAIAVTPKR